MSAAILFFGLVMWVFGFIAGTGFTAYVLVSSKPTHQLSDDETNSSGGGL